MTFLSLNSFFIRSNIELQSKDEGSLCHAFYQVGVHLIMYFIQSMTCQKMNGEVRIS